MVKWLNVYLGTKFSTGQSKAVDGVYLESTKEFQRGQGLGLPPSQGNNTKIMWPPAFQE